MIHPLHCHLGHDGSFIMIVVLVKLQLFMTFRQGFVDNGGPCNDGSLVVVVIIVVVVGCRRGSHKLLLVCNLTLDPYQSGS